MPFKPKDPSAAGGRFLPRVQEPPPPPVTREEREARIAALESERAELQPTLRRAEALAPTVEPARRIGQIATAPARGIIGTGAFLESGITGPASIISGSQVRGPFQAATDALSPPDLDPRTRAERFERRGLEFAGGALTGIGAGQRLAQGGNAIVQSPFPREIASRLGETATQRLVGRTLAEHPGRQLVAAGTGSVGAQTAQERGYNELTQALAGLAAGAPAFIGAAPRPAPGPPLPRPAVEPAEVARAARLVLPPSAKPGAKGALLETLAGPPQVKAESALRNKSELQAHALAELDLKGPQKLSTETFRQLEQPHIAVYDELQRTVPTLDVSDPVLQQALSPRTNPLIGENRSLLRLRERASRAGIVPTEDVLQAIREWRADARIAAKTLDDPEKMRISRSLRETADAFEDALARAAEPFDPGLVQRFREARTRLAKIKDVEAATVDGFVDVAELAKMAQGGHPLSGRLALLADLGRWFPGETQHVSSVRVPASQSIPLLRLMGGRLVQMMGRGTVDDILLNPQGRFQRQFGDVDPAPGPGSPLGAFFDTPGPRTPPTGGQPPPAPGGAPLDFNPTAGVPPAAAARLAGDLGLAPEAVPGAVDLPPATARPGDLTASTPPLPEGIPFQPTSGRLADDLAAGLELAPEPVGDIPFRPGQVPPEAGLAEFQGIPADRGPLRPFEAPPGAAIPENLAAEPPTLGAALGEAVDPNLGVGGFDANSLVAQLFEQYPGLRESVHAGLEATLNEIRAGGTPDPLDANLRPGPPRGTR